MSDLLLQETPEAAIGTVQNYLAVAYRYDYQPEPEVIVRLFEEMGYRLTSIGA